MEADRLISIVELVTSGLRYDTFEGQLARIYGDGYVGSGEEGYLKGIVAFRSEESRYGITVDPKAQALAKRLLQSDILTRQKLLRFSRKHRLLSLEDKLLKQSQRKDNAQPPVVVGLTSLIPLEKGAFEMIASLQSGDHMKQLTIILPDEEGNYPGSNRSAGSESTLIASIDSTIAMEALSRAITSADENQKQQLRFALESVDRIGQKPITLHEAGESFSCRIAETRGNSSLPDLIVQHAHRQARGKRTFIKGIAFSGVVSAEMREKIETALAPYPDYLLRAFGRLKMTIFLFDSQQIYTKLMNEGAIRQAPQAGLSFAQDGEVFLDLHYLDQLGHEIFHVFSFAGPEEHSLAIVPFDFSFVLQRLVSDAEKRFQFYPESAFTTSYQSANYGPFKNGAEYIAEALDVYYRGEILRPGHIGTREELRDEDPILFLCLEQMDELLKSERPELPYWAAFSETAYARAIRHLDSHGEAWNAVENLQIFREATHEMSIDEERTLMSLSAMLRQTRDQRERYRLMGRLIETAISSKDKLPFHPIVRHVVAAKDALYSESMMWADYGLDFSAP